MQQTLVVQVHVLVLSKNLLTCEPLFFIVVTFSEASWAREHWLKTKLWILNYSKIVVDCLGVLVDHKNFFKGYRTVIFIFSFIFKVNLNLTAKDTIKKPKRIQVNVMVLLKNFDRKVFS